MLVRTLGIALFASLLGAPSALAATCETSERYVPQASAVTVRSDASGGDWDLTLRDRESEAVLEAAASAGPDERVTAIVEGGRTVVAEACRRAGGGALTAIAFDLDVLPTTPPPTLSLVSVRFDSPAGLARLAALGFDLSEHVEGDRVDVVLYGDDDRWDLAQAGYSFETKVSDLGALERAQRAAEADGARAPSTRALASGRTAYRQLADYQNELKGLADANPGLVRSLKIGDSLENRPIEGVEISDGVNRTDDGRPVYVVMGNHHAREWPSGEFAMEHAIDLVDRFKAGEGRIRSLLGKVRVVVLPVINVDGFAASRSYGTAPTDDDPNATLPQIVADQAAYKRKNCRPTSNDAVIACRLRTGSGVDLNRNYGAFWGGDGSSSDTTTQGYRGPAPYSEPESAAVRAFSRGRQIVTLITNHTFTKDGKWLRQPGFKIPNDPVPDVTADEARMKALGDAMGQATGWTSELGYQTLGNITGATEDWNYFAQGTFGYTPEMKGSNFHATYATMVVAEWDGGNGGVREALLRAAEQSADTTDHSVVEGSAPAGRTLRLKKDVSVQTSNDNDGDGVPDKPAQTLTDTLETTLTVPANGRYEWHVNPSTQPLIRAAGQRQSWTLTCEDAGTVIETRPVVVDRGERVTADLTCGASTSGPGGGGPGSGGGSGSANGNGAGEGGGGASVGGLPGGVALVPGATGLVERPTLRIAATRGLRASARALNRRKRLVVPLSARSGEAEAIKGELRKGRRVIARGNLERIAGDDGLAFRLRRRISPGRYTVVVTARGLDRTPLRATAPLTVRR